MDIRINYEIVSIDRVKPNAWNPNIQTDFIFEHEIKSIKKHGFIAPIIVRELDNGTLEIVDGEHRYKAALKLGSDKIAVNNLGKIDIKDSKALTVIMNEVRGKADTFKMGELIKDLNNSFGMDFILDSMPMTEIEINNMLGNASIDWDAVTPDSTNSSDSTNNPAPPKDAEHSTLSFHVPAYIAEQFNEQLQRFKTLLFPDDINVQDTMPLQAMIEILRITPDEDIID